MLICYCIIFFPRIFIYIYLTPYTYFSVTWLVNMFRSISRRFKFLHKNTAAVTICFSGASSQSGPFSSDPSSQSGSLSDPSSQSGAILSDITKPISSPTNSCVIRYVSSWCLVLFTFRDVLFYLLFVLFISLFLLIIFVNLILLVGAGASTRIFISTRNHLNLWLILHIRIPWFFQYPKGDW